MSNISPVARGASPVERAEPRATRTTTDFALHLDAAVSRPAPAAAVSVAAEQALPRPLAQVSPPLSSLRHPRALAHYAAAAALRSPGGDATGPSRPALADPTDIVSPLALPT